MPVFSVSTLNEYVGKLLGRDPMLSNVSLRGELSGFKAHSSGHLYFSLKDERSLIRCVMFRQNAQGLAFMPKDGEQLLLRGSVAIYARDGQYQFYVNAMEREGEGELYQQFLLLKAKLEAEGLFEAGRKKPIPFLPRTVGVVTAETGAVIADIHNVIRRRYPNMNILLKPARVQGEGAAASIAQGIDELNEIERVDVIIVGRGGGSIEDLWPFNEEIVARSIAGSRVPVVSAVGHETDFTIADFAADLRAPTPSAAAELCVPVKDELALAVNQAAQRMAQAVRRQLSGARQEVQALKNSRAMAHSETLIAQNRAKLTLLRGALGSQIKAALAINRETVALCLGRLSAMNPAQVLQRGYAAVRKTDGTAASAKTLQKNERIALTFHDGRAVAVIDEVTRK